MSQQKVKLRVYAHEAERTLVDVYTAQAWDDFIILRVSCATPELLHHMAEVLQEKYPKGSKKQLLIVPAEVDVEFYGIKEVD